MLSPISRISEAFRETLLHKAKGTAFNRLVAWYGFKKPRYIEERYWREATLHSIFSARGTPRPVFSFLEHVFGEWTDTQSTYENVLAVSSYIIDITGATCTLEGRYCRIDGEMHRISHLNSNGHLVLHAVDTMMFKGASLTAGSTYTVKVLPFDVEEYDCEYRVILDSGVLQFPRTYLREDGEVRTTDPYGGHIMDFFSSVFSERYGNQITGAYPIYLGADEFASLFFESFEMMLASGIDGKVTNQEWCPLSGSIYGSIYNRKVYGTVSPTLPAIVQPTRN